MKVSSKGISRYLAKEDLPEPIVATMATVAVESLKSSRGHEDKYILYFTDRELKPMVLNVGNTKRLIQAFGDETDGWAGKAIEIYVDPNVEMGGEVVGGIRIRVPANRPQQRPAFQRPPAKPAMSIEDKHKFLIEEFAAAKTEARLHQLAERAKAQDFADHHSEEQSDAYHAAMERLGLVEPAGSSDIPF